MSHYYFKKHLGTSWLEEKPLLYFEPTETSIYGSRANVKRGCSFWCLTCKYTSYWLFQMCVYKHYKGLRWDFLRPKRVTGKVYTPKSVNTLAATLCPSISELWDRYSQRQMAPRLPRSPNISKCQVSDCR